MRLRAMALSVVLATLAGACTSSNPVADEPQRAIIDLPACGASRALRVLPLAAGQIASLDGQGSFDPPLHVLPSRAVTLVVPGATTTGSDSVPVLAPATGFVVRAETIRHEDEGSFEDRVHYRWCDGQVMVMEHITVTSPAIRDAMKVRRCNSYGSVNVCVSDDLAVPVIERQQIGTTSGRGRGLSLALFDADDVDAAAVAARADAICPLDAFAPSQRAYLRSAVRSGAACSAADAGKTGTAAGAWFLKDAPRTEWNAMFLSRRPTPRISLGPGVGARESVVVGAAGARFEAMRPGTGVHCIGTAPSTFLIEMSDATTMRFEPLALACRQAPRTVSNAAITLER